MLSSEGLYSRLRSSGHASCSHQVSPAFRRGIANRRASTRHGQSHRNVQVVQARNARQREPIDILAETDFEVRGIADRVV
eukprot:1145443-Pelagomonas_calceolata.AAC.1